MRYIFTCRSLTYAQRSSRLLEHSGIFNTIIKSPADISDRGCGYSVSVSYKSGKNAADILKKNNLLRKIYLQTSEDGYREATL